MRITILNTAFCSKLRKGESGVMPAPYSYRLADTEKAPFIYIDRGALYLPRNENGHTACPSRAVFLFEIAYFGLYLIC